MKSPITKAKVLAFLKKQEEEVRPGYISVMLDGEDGGNDAKLVFKYLLELEKEKKVKRHYYSDKSFNWLYRDIVQEKVDAKLSKIRSRIEKAINKAEREENRGDYRYHNARKEGLEEALNLV